MPIGTSRPEPLAVHLAIIGDYDPTFPPHRATDTSVAHAAGALGLHAVTHWLATDAVGDDPAAALGAYDALWIAPGSPYRSLTGALRAIRYARERGVPLIGT